MDSFVWDKHKRWRMEGITFAILARGAWERAQIFFCSGGATADQRPVVPRRSLFLSSGTPSCCAKAIVPMRPVQPSSVLTEAVSVFEA